MISCSLITKRIIDEFGTLWECRTREKSIEIITPLSTIERKFVSVFISLQGSEYVVSDGGWVLDGNYFRDPPSLDLENNAAELVAASYSLKTLHHPSGRTFFYKKSSEESALTSAVYDVAMFVMTAANALSLAATGKDEKTRVFFRSATDEFLKSTFSGDVKFGHRLEDLQQIKFNAVITRDSSLYLVCYVTGSNEYTFKNDICKAYMNFRASRKTRYASFIRARISLINDASTGYNPDSHRYFLGMLAEESNSEPLPWSLRDRLPSLVS